VNPGYKTSGTLKCCGDAKDGDYCKGLAVDAACTATGEVKCGVGLFCDGTKCKAVLARGADCKAGEFCQSNELCYSGKCTPFFSIEDGKDALIEALCKSGHIVGGKCQKATTYKGTSVWFDNAKALADACEYEDRKEAAVCAPATGDKTKAVYCMKYDSSYTQTDLKAMYTGWKDNFCMGGDIICDKFLDSYGCTKAKTAAKAGAYFAIDMESVNAECIPNSALARIDSQYKCFSSELVWGILSVLAIVLLI
jgi:hypothetical protein